MGLRLVLDGSILVEVEFLYISLSKHVCINEPNMQGDVTELVVENMNAPPA